MMTPLGVCMGVCLMAGRDDLVSKLEYAAKQCCNRQYAKLFAEAVEELNRLEELVDDLWFGR